MILESSHFILPVIFSSQTYLMKYVQLDNKQFSTEKCTVIHLSLYLIYTKRDYDQQSSDDDMDFMLLVGNTVNVNSYRTKTLLE